MCRPLHALRLHVGGASGRGAVRRCRSVIRSGDRRRRAPTPRAPVVVSFARLIRICRRRGFVVRESTEQIAQQR